MMTFLSELWAEREREDDEEEARQDHRLPTRFATRMSRIYDPIGWLKQNARPSWKITLTLSPYHTETDKVEPVFHQLSSKEVGQIEKLTREYEYELPAIGEALDIDDFSCANQDVVVRIPRRNGGHTVFFFGYDHGMDVWFSNKNIETRNPKDKVITFEEAVVKLTKKPRKPR